MDRKARQAKGPARERELLTRLAVHLAEAESPEQLAETLERLLADHFAPDAFFVTRRLPDGNEFRCLRAFDTIDGVRTALDVCAMNPTVHRPYRALREGKAVLIGNKPEETDGLLRFGSNRRSACRLYAPIHMWGRIFGVVSLQSYTEGYFNESDRDFLKTVCDVVAPTLQRIHTEMAARKREQRYRQAIEIASAVPYERNLRTHQLHSMGEGIAELTGYRAEELTPEIWDAMVQETVLYGSLAGLSMREAAEKVANGEVKEWLADYRVRTRDGRELWLSDSAVIVHDDKGRPSTSLGILQDITAKQRAGRLNAVLTRLGRELSGAVTPREVALVTLQAAQEVIGWDASYLGLYSADDDMMQTLASFDTVRRDVTEVRSIYPKPSPPTASVRRAIEQDGLVINRAPGSGEQPSGVSPFGNMERLSASLLYIPIREKREKIVGVLSIQSYRPNAYEKEDLGTLRVLADHCAGALARTFAEANLRRTQDKSAAFATLAQQLNAVRTPRDAGLVIAEAAGRLIGWDACSIDLYSPEEEVTYEVFAIDTVDCRKVEFPRDYRRRPLTPLGRRVLREGAFLILRDPESVAREGHCEGGHPFGHEDQPSQSLMFVPARHGLGVGGIITIQSYRPYCYTQEDLETLQALADFCGGALERLRAERALREERNRLRTLIDNLPDFIYIKDREHRFVLNNKAHYRALGVGTEAETLGRTDHEFWPREVAQRFIEEEEHLLRTGMPDYGLDTPLEFSDGARRTLLTSKIPLRDEEGEVVGLVGIGRDITDMKRNQERLAAFAELARGLSATSTAAEAGRLIIWTARQLLGWDASYIVLYDKFRNEISPLFVMDTIEGDVQELSLQYEFTGEPEGYARKAIEEGCQLVLRDRDLSFLEVTPTFGDTRRSLSLMFVPIVLKDSVIGVLSIQSYALNAYTQEDLGLLTALAQQCGGALERLRVQAALHASEERYALAARGANDGLWDWDLLTDEIYYSPRLKELMGYDETELRNRPEEWFCRVHPQDLAILKDALHNHLEGNSSHFQNEHRLMTRDGGYRWVLCRGVAVRGVEERPIRIAGSMTDITERREAEEQLTEAAFYDPLTKLANRALFMDRLEHCLARNRRKGDFRYAVLFIDLDRFKMINDSLGHLVGDKLLQEIAARLLKSTRQGDTVARLGGDEFTVLIEDYNDDNQPIRVAKRLIDELAEPFQIDGHEIFTSASVGIALSSSGYQRVEEVLRDADTALYRAKETGRCRYVLFDQKMHESVTQVLDIENGLRSALRNDEFRLAYQPIFSIADRRIRGVEALIRWHRPGIGIVPPQRFIPVAEDTGLIVPIGEWVMREACRQMAQWQREYPAARDLFMSINISPRQFSSPGLRSLLEDIVLRTGLQPQALHAEITETAILTEPDNVRAVLERWRSLGVRIALDDFGTGYSPLAHLVRFPVDYIKIDRSFVGLMGQRPECRHIVRAVVSLARIFNLSVIAEGAETSDQLDALEELHCDYVQGYYLSHPVEPDDLCSRFLAPSSPVGGGSSRLPANVEL